MIKSMRRGKGLTERTVVEVTFSDIEQALQEPNRLQEVKRWMANAVPTLEERLDAICTAAARILTRHKMPIRSGVVVVANDRTWSWLDPADDQALRKKQCTSAAYVKELFDEETEPWYAASMLELIDDILGRTPSDRPLPDWSSNKRVDVHAAPNEIERGNELANIEAHGLACSSTAFSSYQVMKALELGSLYREAVLKFRFDDDVVFGQKMKSGRAGGGKAGAAATRGKANEREEAIVKIARDLVKQDLSLLKNRSELARQIEKCCRPELRHGARQTQLKLGTIRGIVSRLSKKELQ